MGETAILMAAGMGTRMQPITRAIPKPLIPVCGTPMIETVIRGLLNRPVEKICVITGYLGYQFEYLEEKYPQVELIANEEYMVKNNISSIYAAGDRLGKADCFICEADLWIQDPSIFNIDFEQSCYYGMPFSGYIDDWIFEINNGRISRVKKGGKDTFQMVGISYFRKDDAVIVREAIRDAYSRPGHEMLFWDEIVDQNLDRLNLSICQVKKGQILELDTVSELAEVDNNYKKYIFEKDTNAC